MIKEPRVAAVVPVFNRLETTRTFVEAFRKLEYSNRILVICDDGSRDGTQEYLRAQSDIITVQGDGNLWWSGGTNAAIAAAMENQPDYILTINDDSIFSPNYLTRLVNAALEHPNNLMASSLVQWQSPDRHWSLGATYLNYGHVLYINDFFGALSSHVSALISSPFVVDTTPGNGVLYPVAVLEKIGLFDVNWTPQYHGDTLLVHRAQRAGFPTQLCLDAVISNDMGHHGQAIKYDRLLSKKSATYAPAMYKSVEEREGHEVAIETLWGLTAAYGGDFCPASQASWKKLTDEESKFTFDPHFAHLASAGEFALLGYETTSGLNVNRLGKGNHIQHVVTGAGLLDIIVRVRRPCSVYFFLITDRPMGHFDVISPEADRGSLQFGEEHLEWFRLDLKDCGDTRVPLCMDVGKTVWNSFYMVSSQNVSPILLQSLCPLKPRSLISQKVMQPSDDTDLIQSLRDQLNAHVQKRISALPVPSKAIEREPEKELRKKQKNYNQASQKFAEWLKTRGKKLAKFPRRLMPGSKTIREVCARLGDHFEKTTKSNTALTSSVASVLQSSSISAQRIAQLEQRIAKLEGERTGLILGLSREVKSLRAQVNEVKTSHTTSIAQ